VPKRRILAVTGTRAEYGLLKPVLRALQKDSRVDLRLAAAGMHLRPEHGLTVREIVRDGFLVRHRVPLHGATPAQLAAAVGRATTAFAAVFNREKPDLVLLLGDRCEVFSAAAAAAYMNLFIAHIHGGDRTRGGVDESARHAVTKLAHFHFPATRRSAARLVKLGENPARVFLSGSPALDDIPEARRWLKDELLRRLKLPAMDYALFVQHPVTSRPEAAGWETAESLNALAALPLPTVAIHPNNDPGSPAVAAALEAFRRRHPASFWTFRNLARREYLGLLRHARVLLGNSSSGVIDAASFKVPVVDVGIRQAGREHSTNVIHVEPKAAAIRRGLARALSPAFAHRLRRCRNLYGDGRSGPRIARVLACLPLRPALLQKQIAY